MLHIAYIINQAQQFKISTWSLKGLNTRQNTDRQFQYYNVCLMQDMQQSTFTAQCISISALLVPVHGNSTTLPEYKVVVCKVQFDEIRDSQIDHTLKRIHF
jgi:hypothetical protein